MEKIISLLDDEIELLTKLRDFHAKNMARADVDCDYGFHYKSFHDYGSKLIEAMYLKTMILKTVEKAGE